MKYYPQSLDDPNTPDFAKAELRGLAKALEFAEWQNDVYRSYFHDLESFQKILDEDYEITDIHLELAKLDFNKYRNIWKKELEKDDN